MTHTDNSPGGIQKPVTHTNNSPGGTQKPVTQTNNSPGGTQKPVTHTDSSPGGTQKLVKSPSLQVRKVSFSHKRQNKSENKKVLVKMSFEPHLFFS